MKELLISRISGEVSSFEEALEKAKDDFIKSVQDLLEEVVIVTETPNHVLIGFPNIIRINPNSPNIFIYGKEIIIKQNKITLSKYENLAVFLTQKNKLMGGGNNSITTTFKIEERSKVLSEIIPYFISGDNTYIKSDADAEGMGKIYFFTSTKKTSIETKETYDFDKIKEEIKEFIKQ